MTSARPKPNSVTGLMVREDRTSDSGRPNPRSYRPGDHVSINTELFNFKTRYKCIQFELCPHFKNGTPTENSSPEGSCCQIYFE